MGAERLEHPERVVVGIAAAEADEMHVGLAERQLDLAGHVMGTLDEIHHGDRVPNPLAAVGPQERIAANGIHRPSL